MTDTRVTRRQFNVSLAGVAAFGALRTRRSRSLEPVVRTSRDLGVRGLVVLRGGETVVSDGDVHEPMRIASIRKSLLSALFGMAVADGRVKLDASLSDLGVDDYTPLTDTERRATVRDLLMARSGVYLPTAAETEAMRAARPARGSHAPGTHWYYNNWDFNVLGEIYQRLTGEGVFTAIEHRLARPLGWRDFDALRDTRWSYASSSPRFPAYNVAMSAHDMSLFGQLYLQRGRWKGRQLVSESWIAESTRSYSTTGRDGAHSGYGYMWWIVDGGAGIDRRGLPAGAFSASGNGGRYITIFPEQNIVVAIQPNERRGEPPVPLYARTNAYSDLLRDLLGALTANR